MSGDCPPGPPCRPIWPMPTPPCHPCYPCYPVCPPPPPTPPPCRNKPIMRHLHMMQMKTCLTISIVLAGISGILGFKFIKEAKMTRYEEFHAKEDNEALAQILDRKGLFKSTPPPIPQDDDD